MLEACVGKHEVIIRQRCNTKLDPGEKQTVKETEDNKFTRNQKMYYKKSEAEKQINKGDVLWLVYVQNDSDSGFLHCKGTNEK